MEKRREAAFQAFSEPAGGWSRARPAPLAAPGDPRGSPEPPTPSPLLLGTLQDVHVGAVRVSSPELSVFLLIFFFFFSDILMSFCLLAAPG